MGKYFKIVHLDAGRKYFSPKSLKKMIAQAAECGYDQFELAVGNDGLRLLLDDMALDGKDSDTIKALIQEGNKEYNGDPSCLTQSEMDDILAFAKEKGIEIVPMVDMPGHMPVALHIDPTYGWENRGMVSKHSVDIMRERPVAFALEMLEKYVVYFASRGCRYFNYGTDEFGNDIYPRGGLGFCQLEEQGYLDYLVAFLNKAADIVIKAGMIPRAFNDGWYYHDDTTMPLNKSVEICYWGKGWIGFDCAAVSTIASMGNPLINSHGSWYYVLKPEGGIQKPTEHKTNEVADFDSFKVDVFPGNQVHNDLAGAMFCIWCDNSTLLTDEEVADDVADQMKAMIEHVMK